MSKRIALSVLLSLMAFAAVAQIRISAPDIEMILDGRPGEELKVRYFGNHLSDEDVSVLGAAGAPDHNAYPPYGLRPTSECALSVTHNDGNMSTVIRIEAVENIVEEHSALSVIKPRSGKEEEA